MVSGRSPTTVAGGGAGQGRAALPSRMVSVFGVVVVAMDALGVLGERGGITFVALAGVALVCTFLGIRYWRPKPSWPWLAVMSALGLWLIGGYLRDVYHTLGQLTADRSLVPDLVSLPGYLVIVIGVIGLVTARVGRHVDTDVTIDASIGAIAAFLVVWAYVITPALSHHHLPIRVRLVVAAYVPCSIFVVATAVRFASTSGHRPPPALGLAVGALIFLVIGDGLYLMAETGRLVVPMRLLDVPFALGFVACSSAVTHPSLPRVTASLIASERSGSARVRLLFVVVALFTPAAVLASDRGGVTGTDRIVVATSAVMLSALAAWRMYRAIRERDHTEKRLDYQVTHDALTALPNRLSARRHIERLIEARTLGSSIAFLCIDLDRFKLVNDTLGNAGGDELLAAVAERLRANVRLGELVTRTGGDEFGIVIHGAASAAAVAEAAERVRLILRRPYRLSGAEIPLSASIGVAVYSASALDAVGGGGGGDAERMFRDAETALYRAKASGGDAVSVFDASMRDRQTGRLTLERDLSHALERGELSVSYQPIVSCATTKVTGVEALLRWRHPTLGMVTPAAFIPIAEESGLIVEIGAWVLDQACEAIAALRTQVWPLTEFTLAVNVSIRQFRDGELLDQVARALGRHDLPAGVLCLELTESVLMENLDSVGAQLAALRARGVRILVDDFGTGYSSIAYLRDLPVNGVKIDRSFVEHIDQNGADASLVGAIVAMADSMSLVTIAEGVEHSAQADCLRALGCAEAQGFLYAAPQPGEDLLAAVRRLGLHAARHLHAVAEGDGAVS